MKEYSYIIAQNSVTVSDGTQTLTVVRSSDLYDRVVKYLLAEDYKKAITVASVANTLQAWVKSTNGRVTVEGNVVKYNGEPVNNALTQKIIEMVHMGISPKPFVNFMENLMQNPSRTAVEELYLFLADGKMFITPDGYFLAYKKVRHDYMDHYTGTFDNSVGSVCEVPRNKVDDNRDRTCSYGLHFCSLSYLPSYGGNNSKVMIVKINPKDVVSIPSDYNNAKGRTCRYEVVGEYENWISKTEYFSKPVYTEYGDPDDTEEYTWEDDDDDWLDDGNDDWLDDDNSGYYPDEYRR